MIRTSGAALLLAVVSCAAPSVDQRPGPIIPVPVAAAGAPGDVAALILELGSEDYGGRERASTELVRRGQDPALQVAVVGALRAAATASDPEIRLRARETLRRIDRSDNLVPGTDRPESPMSFSVSGAGVEMSVKFWQRLFADGSAELEVEVNGGPRELFSGSSVAELASRVNEAARKRGYSPEQFQMLENGGMKFGGSTITSGEPGRDHLLRDWGLWVSLASRSDGLTPPAVWGGWVVQARALSGKAFESGIQLRDVLLEVDGKKASTIQELASLLNQAREITVVRSEPRRVVLTPK